LVPGSGRCRRHGADPRERELARRARLLVGDLAHALDEVEVALEVLALEARVVAAEVASSSRRATEAP
jgi:hypothetical protein